MEEIKGFKLSDGRIIENREEAIKLQKELDFKKAIWALAEREGSYYEGKNAIYNAIVDNVKELREIFDIFMDATTIQNKVEDFFKVKGKYSNNADLIRRVISKTLSIAAEEKLTKVGI